MGDGLLDFGDLGKAIAEKFGLQGDDFGHSRDQVGGAFGEESGLGEFAGGGVEAGEGVELDDAEDAALG
ncbi:MAG: hypothetical protein RI897_4122 [Verrucomicrobiota bacterium]